MTMTWSPSIFHALFLFTCSAVRCYCFSKVDGLSLFVNSRRSRFGNNQINSIRKTSCKATTISNQHGQEFKASSEYQSVPLSVLLNGVAQYPAIRQIGSQSNYNWKNRYIGLRHGQSEANIEGIISSMPEKGISSHGLTELGRQQAREAACTLQALLSKAIPEQNGNTNNIIWITSDFKRARETLEECLRTLCLDVVPEVQMSTELRERGFGDLDGKALIFYNQVWPIDTLDAENNRHGVESVNDVIRRVTPLFLKLEEQYSNKVVVLVSHADTLQITQTFFLACSTGLNTTVDPRLFHQYRFFNGEVRDLSALPTPAPIPYK